MQSRRFRFDLARALLISILFFWSGVRVEGDSVGRSSPVVPAESVGEGLQWADMEDLGVRVSGEVGRDLRRFAGWKISTRVLEEDAIFSLLVFLGNGRVHL